MPRKKVKAWREDEAPRRTPWSHVRTTYRAVRTTLVVLVILYVAALAATRTDGFRDVVASRLEQHFGLPVKIESVAASPRFDLTLRGLVTEGTRQKNSPGLRAHQVVLGWAWGDLWRHGRVGLRRLELERCVITFARDDQQAWQPADLVPLSEFLAKWLQLDLGPAASASNAATVAVAERPAGTPEPDALEPEVEKPAAAAGRAAARALQDGHLSVALRRSEITWWGDGDVPLAAVEGVSLTATPVRLPNRTLTHYHLKLEHAAGAKGLSVSDMTLEVLDTGDQQLVLVFDAGHTSGLMKR
jgi:hypothetical protein